MILRKLQLENFRSFERGELTFSESQNYIVGGNWQGKSSIVEAIAFALFGADARSRRVAGASVTAGDFVRVGARSAAVELAFEVRGEEYVISRALPASRVSLTRSGKLVARDKKTVDEILRDALAVDAKFFRNVFYADQDELRRAFDQEPRERKAFIEQMIGQEVWQERAAAIRGAINHLEKFIAELSSGRFGVFVAELDRLASEIEEDKAELAGLSDELETLRARAPKTRRAVREAERAHSGGIAEAEHVETRLEVRRRGVKETIEGLTTGVCPVCTQKVPAALRRRRLVALEEDLRGLSAELRRQKKFLETLRARDEAEAFERAYEDVEQLRVIEERHAGMEKGLREKTAREARLRRDARVFGKKPEHHSRARQETEFLKALLVSIDEHRGALRARVVEAVVGSMNDLLARFHDGDFDAAGAIDGDLALRVSLHGANSPLTSLSGAAKDIFALALRYGLMRVAARRMDCFILDEPTRHMDPRNVRQLRTVFDEMQDQQLLVVTVEEEFADAKGKHFSVSKDDSLRSVVTEL